MHSLDDLIQLAKERGTRSVAVAQSADEHVVEALALAEKEGIARPVFVGPQKETEALALKAKIENPTFIDATVEEAPVKAVKAIRQGEASVLMKGLVNTTPFLRAVLNREEGLRTKNRLSLLAVYQLPFYHKLLFATDSGVNVAPDFALKEQILQNALHALYNIGFKNPKVAFLCANEIQDKSMPHTIDAYQLADQYGKDDDYPGIFKGPLSFDTAFDVELAKHKGVESEVCGDLDLLFFPNIETGNALGKSWLLFGGASWAGILLGATHPIVLGSRSDSPTDKLRSIALASVASL